MLIVGYKPPTEYEAGDADTWWREVNDAALRNLDRWVSALGLPGTRQSGKATGRSPLGAALKTRTCHSIRMASKTLARVGNTRLSMS